MYGEQSELGLGNSRRLDTMHGRSDRKQVQKSVLGYSLAKGEYSSSDTRMHGKVETHGICLSFTLVIIDKSRNAQNM